MPALSPVCAELARMAPNRSQRRLSPSTAVPSPAQPPRGFRPNALFAYLLRINSDAQIRSKRASTWALRHKTQHRRRSRAVKSEDSAAKTGFSSRALGPQCATNHYTRWALHSGKPMNRHFVVRPLNEFRYVAFASCPHSSSAAGEPLFCGKNSRQTYPRVLKWVCIANQPDRPANTEARPHKAVRYYRENRIEVLPQLDVTHVHESLNEAPRARKCQAARQCPNRQPAHGIRQQKKDPAGSLRHFEWCRRRDLNPQDRKGH